MILTILAIIGFIFPIMYRFFLTGLLVYMDQCVYHDCSWIYEINYMNQTFVKHIVKELI